MFHRKVPIILQNEAAECGLACIGMIAGYHGYRTDLLSLRQRFAVSLRGLKLAHLMLLADRMGFACRPLRIELEELRELQTPCILHWNMNHFVVLKYTAKNFVVIHDPASGVRRVSHSEISRRFTGVALELTPTPAFTPKAEQRSVRFRDLTGKITGMKRAMFQIFVSAAALELVTLISPLFLQLAMDKVVAVGNRHLISTLGIGFICLIAFQAALTALRNWSTLYFGTSLMMQWHARIFAHLLKLPVAFFEKRCFGDIISKLEGVDVVEKTLTHSCFDALLDGTISLLLLGMMMLYNPALTMIVLVSVLAYAGLRSAVYRPLRVAKEQEIAAGAKQHTFLIETLRGIRTIKIFNREGIRTARWMNLLTNSTNSRVTTEKIATLFRSANTFVFGVQSVLIIWLGALRVLNRSFSIGMLFAFVAYQETFKVRMATFIDRCFELKILAIHLHRLADIAFEKPECLPENILDVADDDTSIEFRDVSFRYSDAEPWILSSATFRIGPGECVAITGPSGAGKSTLLKLIAGLLQPQRGKVILCGHSLSLDRVAASRRVGFVLQDDCLFAGTISENIAFAADEIDLARVAECARQACIEEEIKAMPMGYSTLVGDMGAALSGGQQQRILLARALYRQPSVLVLDEATSFLDIATEQRVAESLSNLGITLVLAAHRPNTIAIAPRVICLSRDGSLTDCSHGTQTEAGAIRGGGQSSNRVHMHAGTIST